MNPFCVPFATTNMGSAMLAMDLGWMGPNSTSTACATTLSAANHILRGEADIMLSCGSNSAIIPIGLGGFVACRALSQRNDFPQNVSRSWNVDRDGFVMGEGDGVFLLEELEHAKCAYHMTEHHPEGTGVRLCIEKALAQAGARKEDVNYVNAHATSTRAGDLQDYKALMKVFGENLQLKVNSTKSMISYLLGEAGAVEAVSTVQLYLIRSITGMFNSREPARSNSILTRNSRKETNCLTSWCADALLAAFINVPTILSFTPSAHAESRIQELDEVYGDIGAGLELGVQLLYLAALLGLVGVGSFFVVKQLLIRRELESAAKELQDRVRTGEALPVEYFELGAVMLRKKFYLLATKYLEQAIDKWDGDPQDLAQVHNALGFSLLSDGKIDKAIAEYEKAVKLQPGYVVAWNNLGSAYDKKRNLPKALYAYEQALLFDPNNSVAREYRDALKERLDRLAGVPIKYE